MDSNTAAKIVLALLDRSCAASSIYTAHDLHWLPRDEFTRNLCNEVRFEDYIDMVESLTPQEKAYVRTKALEGAEDALPAISATSRQFDLPPTRAEAEKVFQIMNLDRAGSDFKSVWYKIEHVYPILRMERCIMRVYATTSSSSLVRPRHLSTDSGYGNSPNLAHAPQHQIGLPAFPTIPQHHLSRAISGFPRDPAPVPRAFRHLDSTDQRATLGLNLINAGSHVQQRSPDAIKENQPNTMHERKRDRRRRKNNERKRQRKLGTSHHVEDHATTASHVEHNIGTGHRHRGRRSRRKLRSSQEQNAAGSVSLSGKKIDTMREGPYSEPAKRKRGTSVGSSDKSIATKKPYLQPTTQATVEPWLSHLEPVSGLTSNLHLSLSKEATSVLSPYGKQSFCTAPEKASSTGSQSSNVHEELDLELIAAESNQDPNAEIKSTFGCQSDTSKRIANLTKYGTIGDLSKRTWTIPSGSQGDPAILEIIRQLNEISDDSSSSASDKDIEDLRKTLKQNDAKLDHKHVLLEGGTQLIRKERTLTPCNNDEVDQSDCDVEQPVSPTSKSELADQKPTFYAFYSESNHKPKHATQDQADIPLRLSKCLVKPDLDTGSLDTLGHPDTGRGPVCSHFEQPMRSDPIGGSDEAMVDRPVQQMQRPDPALSFSGDDGPVASIDSRQETEVAQSIRLLAAMSSSPVSQRPFLHDATMDDQPALVPTSTSSRKETDKTYLDNDEQGLIDSQLLMELGSPQHRTTVQITEPGYHVRRSPIVVIPKTSTRIKMQMMQEHHGKDLPESISSADNDDNESTGESLNTSATQTRKRESPKSKSTRVSKHFEVASPRNKRVPAGTSSIVFPKTTALYFGLIQETLCQDPFRLLVAVTFLNKTAGQSALPIFWQLIEQYPTSTELANANQGEVSQLIHRLGFQNQRAKKLIRLANEWNTCPPQKGVRHRTLHYPSPGDAVGLRPRTTIEGDTASCRGANEIAHFYGLGPYAWDSWRIFCRDVLRSVATGYNGEGAEDDFEPEWKRVLPKDKELRAYLRWMWLREGYVWDPLTGECEMADKETLTRAAKDETQWDVPEGVSSPSKSLLPSQISQLQAWSPLHTVTQGLEVEPDKLGPDASTAHPEHRVNTSLHDQDPLTSAEQRIGLSEEDSEPSLLPESTTRQLPSGGVPDSVSPKRTVADDGMSASSSVHSSLYSDTSEDDDYDEDDHALYNQRDRSIDLSPDSPDMVRLRNQPPVPETAEMPFEGQPKYDSSTSEDEAGIREEDLSDDTDSDVDDEEYDYGGSFSGLAPRQRSEEL